MAIAERLAEEKTTAASVPVPDAIEERIKRGKARVAEDAPLRRVCFKFWRGEQYYYVQDGRPVTEATVTRLDGSGKPRWISRTARNLILDVVAHEVSTGTSRVPNYEVDPSTSDPEDVSAARLGGKVARYGWDKWGVRHVTASVITHAVVADEGFAWPHWDPTVGPFIDDGEDGVIGQGEVAIGLYSANEVFWEPGLTFEESRWHGVQQARTVESVQQMEGFTGIKLTPDANTEDTAGETQQAKLVMVTEYLERPSIKKPEGRWLTIANQKQVVPERPFPCRDHEGNVVDEPVLHKLSYFTDPDSDRDMGLGRHLLDPQRTINECVNMQILWQRLALNPQIVIQNGEFKQRITTEPGAVYHAVGSGEIKWRDVPNIPSELSQLKDEAKTDIAKIAAQNEIPSQVASAGGIQSLIENDQNRRTDFIANLAEFHSRLMRHCLYLVQRHYTEERLLKIRGRFGPELIPDFLGADLRGQVDVTVLPGSIEPRSRQQVEARVMNYAQLGWISPEAAMAAINGGTAEQLVESYELDVARANQLIQKIKGGPDVLLTIPPRQPFPDEEQPIDPETGQPLPIPGWMPRPHVDNVQVWKAVLADWMKTNDYDLLDPPSQEAANQVFSGLLMLEMQQAAREAAMQTEMAQSLGMANAAKPQTGKPMPSLPAMQGGGNGSAPA